MLLHRSVLCGLKLHINEIIPCRLYCVKASFILHFVLKIYLWYWMYQWSLSVVIEWIDYTLFIHSPINGAWVVYTSVWFGFAIMNQNAMSICKQIFLWTSVFIYFAQIFRSRVLSHRIGACLVLWEIIRPFYNPTNNVWKYDCPNLHRD